MSKIVTTQVPQRYFGEFQKSIENFKERNSDYVDWFDRQLENPVFADQLSRTWFGSQYASDVCNRRPELFKELVDKNALTQSADDNAFSEQLISSLSGIDDTEKFDVVLRRNRAKEMLRIIWRDVNRLSGLDETTRDISLLAEASIQQALDFHHHQLSSIYGTPMALVDDVQTPQHMIVLGMGKLGAWELNLSSDIDLIFSYPHNGETVGAGKCLDNGEFFTRLARKLIQSIDQITVDGFVFRVDMRLRPYGESGALVLSFGAMEEYYQDQGRDWERYAMIKARVVAGKSEHAQQIMDLLRPFTYRRYIDFSAIDSLRSMKKMITREAKRRGLSNDVKLGAGGIREVEFIAQCFQLIRGGRDTELQERRVQKVLALLAENHCLPAVAVDELLQAYVFLRNTEHGIQAFKDQQSQTLPSDDYPRCVLAFYLGFDSWESFSAELNRQRTNVSRHFGDVITDPEDDSESEELDTRWYELWSGELDSTSALKLLRGSGHEAAEEILTRLARLRDDSTVQRMQTVGRERLGQFMPLLLQAVSVVENPSLTLLRILPFVESVIRRTAYLVLLVENPVALRQLVMLCAGSSWIAAHLTRHPVLLDELLDPRTVYQVPTKAILRDELHQQFLRLPWDDLEAQMEALRYFKQAHQLYVSAAEVTGKLPLMKVSDYLTVIAEVILEHVLELAWHNLTEKHGYPQTADGVPCDKDFIVVGYGKLGGLELGHSSDLDLVFIHDGGEGLVTDGKRPVDNGMFFTRLGQRMIHIMTAQTPSGMLYDVDMRLRPSGTSGLLVTSIKAFESYQWKDAWTWEHQALVRARVVAGDANLAKKFEALRRKLLCEPRDPAALKTAVVEMRHKMRDHLGSKSIDQDKQFHLKQDAGGIVDIEFLAQYAVLSEAARHPELADWSDNVRILESLQSCGVMSAEDAEGLTEAYKTFRSVTHRLALQQQKNMVGADEFLPERRLVKALWQRWFGEGES
ncbi:MAG: bifunctional [glutamate--ammonia ligase]-adenylyl-L-tyrosine phosphorylase/[glutamate--ammonia-ligase] adenylyltransferase [Oceanicoccus sp.]